MEIFDSSTAKTDIYYFAKHYNCLYIFHAGLHNLLL